MKLPRMLVWMAAAALAGAATRSEAVSGNGSAEAQTRAQSEASAASPSATAEMKVDAEAAALAKARVEEIKAKGAKLSVNSRTRAEAKLKAPASAVEVEAHDKGDATVASRLAAEFGLTTEAILAEHGSLGASWGELMIAHTLSANSTEPITVRQLIEMHADGMGWGQIAGGLDMSLGEMVSAVRAEGRVAAGLDKPDGRVAPIRGAGARGSVGAGAGAGAGAQAGVKAGAGVGASVSLPKVRGGKP